MERADVVDLDLVPDIPACAPDAAAEVDVTDRGGRVRLRRGVATVDTRALTERFLPT